MKGDSCYLFVCISFAKISFNSELHGFTYSTYFAMHMLMQDNVMFSA